MEYQWLPRRLKLNGAICLEPLSSEEVSKYLAEGGSKLAALREAVATDPVLQDLAQTPLMLSIMSLACQGVGSDEFATQKGNLEERRKQICRADLELSGCLTSSRSPQISPSECPCSAATPSRQDRLPKNFNLRCQVKQKGLLSARMGSSSSPAGLHLRALGRGSANHDVAGQQTRKPMHEWIDMTDAILNTIKISSPVAPHRARRECGGASRSR
jgi:hypothetical protein